MFLDGVIYAAISKNMSLGLGSIWQPFYTKTLFPHFFEHPSLAFFLQSLYFKCLGQGYLVERLYSLTMALFQIALVIYVWSKEKGANKFSIIMLLLFWVLIPLNVSTYKNNMLEMTATFFSTLSACMLICYVAKNVRGYFFSLSAVAITMLLGFLSNGPTVLFPLVIPLLQAFIYKNNSYKSAIKTTIALIVLGALYTSAFFLWQEGALYNIQQYLSTQLLASISGNRDLSYTGLKHLKVLDLFFKAYWPISALAFLMISSQIKKLGWRPAMNEAMSKKTLFYFLLALAASLPVGISHRQSFHYIAQSAPFYLLAIMHFINPVFQAFTNNMQVTASRLSALFISSLFLVVFSASFVAYKAGGEEKHADMIHDVNVMAAYLPKNEIIDASDTIYDEWDLAAYFARNSFVSVSNTHKQKFYLTLKKVEQPMAYKKVPLELLMYDLWQK